MACVLQLTIQYATRCKLRTKNIEHSAMYILVIGTMLMFECEISHSRLTMTSTVPILAVCRTPVTYIDSVKCMGLALHEFS